MFVKRNSFDSYYYEETAVHWFPVRLYEGLTLFIETADALA